MKAVTKKLFVCSVMNNNIISRNFILIFFFCHCTLAWDIVILTKKLTQRLRRSFSEYQKDQFFVVTVATQLVL